MSSSRGGGTGRRAAFRAQWGYPRKGSSPFLGTEQEGPDMDRGLRLSVPAGHKVRDLRSRPWEQLHLLQRLRNAGGLHLTPTRVRDQEDKQKRRER